MSENCDFVKQKRSFGFLGKPQSESSTTLKVRVLSSEQPGHCQEGGALSPSRSSVAELAPPAPPTGAPAPLVGATLMPSLQRLGLVAVGDSVMMHGSEGPDDEHESSPRFTVSLLGDEDEHVGQSMASTGGVSSTKSSTKSRRSRASGSAPRAAAGSAAGAAAASAPRFAADSGPHASPDPLIRRRTRSREASSSAAERPGHLQLCMHPQVQYPKIHCVVLREGPICCTP